MDKIASGWYPINFKIIGFKEHLLMASSTFIKKLIVITPGFPSDENDTSCLPTQQIFVKALKKSFPELEIKIITLFYPATTSLYKWNNISVTPFHGKVYGKIFRPLLWFKVIRHLKKLNKTGIDGILSFWYTDSAIISELFSRISGIPHFCWIKGQDAKKNNLFVKMIKIRNDRLIALSDFLATEFHTNHGIKPTHVVPNGIDISYFKETNSEKDIDILGVGSLIPLKQYSIFISVVADLKKHLPDIKVVLCGKGAEEKNIRDQIATLRLQNQVTLTGELPHVEALALMQRSKILLHPSSYEGYSTVCLEALYAGCHVISFHSAEVAKIEHWHIVNDKDEMTTSCLSLLKSNSIKFTPVLRHSLINSAESIMKLFFAVKELQS
jgi:glycosyltransferase involved in cell wall biosynthesis